MIETELYCLLNRTLHWKKLYRYCQHHHISTVQQLSDHLKNNTVPHMSQKKLQQFRPTLQTDLEWAAQHPHHHCIPFHHDDYPALLRYISVPPALLYVMGDITCLKQAPLAIVGARAASPLGKDITQHFAHALSEYGFTLVSGLAAGIDAATHHAVCERQGKSVAIMPAGLQHITPQKHRCLAQRIMQRGALISEIPPYTTPKPYHFPRRNRLISGVSLGTLIVEARRASGSMITAYQALEQNRTVMAIPGSMRHDLSEGCLHLIQQGAACITSIHDILALLNLPNVPCPFAQIQPTTHPVLQAVDFTMTDFSTLIHRTHLRTSHLLSALTQLTLKGYIQPFKSGWIRLY